jgi:hypothetical protein
MDMDRPAWIPDLLGQQCFDGLASTLSGSQLQSLLLEVMRQRAAARTPAQVLSQYEADRFCTPAAVDPRVGLTIDSELFAAAAGFEAIELSPVAPLGACSQIALTDQNRVRSALRTSEVVADSTNVLALECARRLRKHWNSPVHLATSQRVLRAQPVPPLPGYAAHFRLFTLASGGCEREDHAFTVDSLVHHVRTGLQALDRLERRGFVFSSRRLELLATPHRCELGDRIAEQIGALAVRKPLQHPYYTGGLRYTLWATPSEGPELPLADGGVFDWLSKLTSNRRAVFIASGIGTQLIALRFRGAQSQSCE